MKSALINSPASDARSVIRVLKQMRKSLDFPQYLNLFLSKVDQRIPFDRMVKHQELTQTSLTINNDIKHDITFSYKIKDDKLDPFLRFSSSNNFKYKSTYTNPKIVIDDQTLDILGYTTTAEQDLCNVILTNIDISTTSSYSGFIEINFCIIARPGSSAFNQISKFNRFRNSCTYFTDDYSSYENKRRYLRKRATETCPPFYYYPDDDDNQKYYDLEPQAFGFNIIPEEVTDKLSGSLDSFQVILDTITGLLGKIGPNTADKINTAIDSIDAEVFKTALDSRISDIKDTLSEASGTMMSGLSLVILTASVVNAASNCTVATCSLVAVSLCAVAFYNRDKLMDSLSYIATYFKPNLGLERQSKELIDQIITGSVLFLSSFAIGSSNAKQMPKEIMMSLGNFSRVKATVSEIFFFFTDVLKKILVHFERGAWLGSISSYKYNSDMIGEVLDEADAIFHCNSKSDFPVNEDNYIRIHSLHSRLRELIMKLPHDSKTAGVHTVLRDVNHKIGKIMDIFAGSNFNFNGVRTEPMSALLFGGPGTFKTEMKEQLVAAIAPLIMDEEDLSKFKKNKGHGVYHCIPENVYSDDYVPSTKICLLDDFAQNVDIAGNPDNEFVRFIRMISIDPLPLNCAELHNKGNKFFTAEVVIATSNFQQMQANSTIAPDAVKRRFNLVVVVHPQPEYRSENTFNADPFRQKFDKNTMPEGHLGVSAIDFDRMFILSEFDIMSQSYTGKVYSFSEFALQITKGVQLRRAYREQRNAQLNLKVAEYESKKKHFIKHDDVGMIDVESSLESFDSSGVTQIWSYFSNFNNLGLERQGNDINLEDIDIFHDSIELLDTSKQGLEFFY